ncbi:MAG: DUF1963 domain-containing protein [Flavobacteriaceae bacterium]|jgi:hypothetical protein|nr:DUF1963 domain-containing protein [Flavobacteriaceae bacterium]
MRSIEELQQEIRKPITKFTTGGFRPENTIEESWLGKVTAYGKNEEIPLDAKGEKMFPLAQFYLPALPFVPETVQKTKVLTVFMSGNELEPLQPMGDNWLIREYENLEDIEIKSLENTDSYIRPFPLKATFADDDCALWDGGGLTNQQEDEVLALERKGEIRSYYDITDHHYDTKFGGYPSYCQSGIGIGGEIIYYFEEDDSEPIVEGYGKGFEFVFQISSDEKANFNVVDGGSLMFAKNKETGEWRMYYDFY